MKKLIASILLLASSIVSAQTGDYIVIRQRNSSDTGYIDRWIYPLGSGKSGIVYLDGSTLLPGFIDLGTGLTITSGVLNATAQVNSDWSAVSGLSQVLNKPSLATVAISGSYDDLSNKPTIPSAYTFDFGNPSTRTLAVSTAYQANNPAKAAIVTISPQCSAALSLSGGNTCSMEARVGSAGLTCSGGTIATTWVNGNTGTLTIGLNTSQTIGSPANLYIPIGKYFVLCPLSGTFTINSAIDQSAG